jgi:hypothetical protein
MRSGEKEVESRVESVWVGEESGEDPGAAAGREEGMFATLRGVRWPAAGCRAGETGCCLDDESADTREACALLARLSVADIIALRRTGG